MGFVLPGVDNWAHGGGFIGGYAAAYVFSRSSEREAWGLIWPVVCACWPQSAHLPCSLSPCFYSSPHARRTHRALRWPRSSHRQQKSRGCVWRRRPRRLGLRLGGLAHILRRRPHPTPTRSHPGDPYLGSLDAPAGGHIRAGETPEAAARREFAEEVGIALTPAELVFLGQQPLQDTGRSAMQFFYLCTRPISLGETVFNEEVGAFVEVGLDDFDSLVCGRTASIQGQAHYMEAPDERGHGKLLPRPRRLFRADHGRHPPLNQRDPRLSRY